MTEFEIGRLVTKLDRMGLKLTAITLADGKMRLYRWRMPNAIKHAQQIQDLWASQIGENQERIDLLAAHVIARSCAGDRRTSGV